MKCDNLPNELPINGCTNEPIKRIKVEFKDGKCYIGGVFEGDVIEWTENIIKVKNTSGELTTFYINKSNDPKM